MTLLTHTLYFFKLITSYNKSAMRHLQHITFYLRTCRKYLEIKSVKENYCIYHNILESFCLKISNLSWIVDKGSTASLNIFHPVAESYDYITLRMWFNLAPSQRDFRRNYCVFERAKVPLKRNFHSEFFV